MDGAGWYVFGHGAEPVRRSHEDDVRRDHREAQMLRRLRIQGFKSLRDVDVELAPLVVLLGPNAAGKSNFLEALVLLSRLGTERTLADAFDVAIRGRVHEAFSLSTAGLPGLLEQDRAEMALEADIDSVWPESRRSARHRYRIATALHPASGELSVADEYLARLRKDGSPTKELPRIQRELLEGQARLVVRQLGRSGHPRYEDTGLNHSLLSNQQYAGGKRYPDFEQLRREFEGWRNYYLDPRTAMRQEEAPREVNDIGARGEHLAAFLNRLQEHPEHGGRFDAVKRALRAVIPTVDDLKVGLDKKRGTIDLDVVQDGVPFSSRVLSEGTLRALALCALAANPWPATLVAFEEPENGVHPRRIETVGKLLAGMIRDPRRQVIVSTHSPRFAAVMAQMGREEPFAGKIRLLRVQQVGQATEIHPLDTSASLLAHDGIESSLRDADEERLLEIGEGVFEEVYARGWLDA